MEENIQTTIEKNTEEKRADIPVAQATDGKVKTRTGSGYLKQLYATARTTATSTHSHFKGLTTFLVNFIPIDNVDASELQVRVHFDDSEIEGLAHSIREHGVLQPILVVQDGDRYKVIAGERRLRAAKKAGLDRIPARVLTTNDRATHEIALRENLDRVDLHPLEEGEAYISLLKAQSYASHDAIAKAFHKPKSRITECIGFCKLPTETKQELLKTGLKNRSVLRQLMAAPSEQHLTIIAQASQVDDLLGGQEGEQGGSLTTPSAKVAAATKGYSYKFDEKGLSMPAFRWKSSEGVEKLKAFSEMLLKIGAEIEDRLTKPN